MLGWLLSLSFDQYLQSVRVSKFLAGCLVVDNFAHPSGQCSSYPGSRAVDEALLSVYSVLPPGRGQPCPHFSSHKSRKRSKMSIRSLLVRGIPGPLKPLLKDAIARIRLMAYLTSRTPIYRLDLVFFLASSSRLHFPPSRTPDLSVIFVIRNEAERTLVCLKSILLLPLNNYELIIVVNGSRRWNDWLLGRIDNATVIANPLPRPDSEARLQAVERSRGDYLLFIDPDTQISGYSIPSAMAAMGADPDIGAVGGKTILPDGRLQSAGGIVWGDGSISVHGRGGDPRNFRYAFSRDVDFIPDGALLTRSGLYRRYISKKVGAPGPGIEPRPRDAGRDPERADYCIGLWEAGKRTVYDPAIVAINVLPERFRQGEGRRGEGWDAAELREQHPDWLAAQPRRSPANELWGRAHGKPKARVLCIDDRIPYPHLGMGLPRTNLILSQMVAVGYSTSYFPIDRCQDDWSEVYAAVDSRVEVVVEAGMELEEHLVERHGYYDIIYIARPTNMKMIRLLLLGDGGRDRPRIVYDAEAIFSLRTIAQSRLSGEPISDVDARRMIDDEMTLVEGCACIVSVSDLEYQFFINHGHNNVYKLGHALEPRPTPAPFSQRRGLLFVGGIYDDRAPNADAVTWFIREIFPQIFNDGGREVDFTVVGTVNPIGIRTLASDRIKFAGRVDDLTPIYDQMRIFVAPTRFAAGIPLKLCEAAAHGLPIVTTGLLADQLGWRDGIEILVADSARDFANQCLRLDRDGDLWERLRANALERIRDDHSVLRFSEDLKRILEETMQ
jgi:O-antigen biosynthesis protein